MKPTTALKVVILLPSLDLGGAEQLVLEELSQFRSDPRFDIELHLLFSEGLLFGECEQLGMRVVCWHARHGALGLLAAYWRFGRYLRKHRIDVLHCHLLYLLGPWCGKLAGVPRTLATMHTLGKLSFLELLALQQCDVVLACSAQVAAHLSALRPTLQVAVLNNAVKAVVDDGLSSSKDVRRTYGLEEDCQVVLSVGRLIYDKGFDILIAAFAQVVSAVPQAVLLVAGSGEEELLLQQQIASLNLAHCVKLLGTVRPVTALISAADLYVNASRPEGMTISLLEAMAHAKPVVATTTGGNSDIVQQGETGELVAIEQPDALALAIQKLLTDAPCRQRYGRAGRARYERDFCITEHCAQLARYYLS